MRPSIYMLIPLSVLVACQQTEKKTAIFVTVQAEDEVVLTDYIDKVMVYVDLESGGFVDGDGTPYESGLYQSDRSYRTFFGDYIETDAELEMGIEIDLSTWDTTLPVIELSPSENNEGPYYFSGAGLLDKTAYFESEVSSAISFSTDVITEHTITLTLMDTPIGPCNNEKDDDEDGYTDADDPDCEALGDEEGFGEAQCNDGQDNDGDGLIDSEDPECEGATDDWFI